MVMATFVPVISKPEPRLNAGFDHRLLAVVVVTPVLSVLPVPLMIWVISLPLCPVI